MGAGSGISGKRALSSLRVCSTVRNILPPQDGLILRPSHAVPDGRRAASEMSDNVQLLLGGAGAGAALLLFLLPAPLLVMVVVLLLLPLLLLLLLLLGEVGAAAASQS